MIESGQRVAIFGLPGDGKTRWEMKLIAPARSCVIFDDKQDPKEWAAWARQHGYLTTADPEQIARVARVHLLVDDLWLSDRAGWKKPGSEGYKWTRANQLLFERGHTIGVFADAHDMLPSTGANPMARKNLRQGRSRGITSLMDFQRPLWADTFAVKMAEHCISFRILDADDVERLRDLRRPADPTPLAQLEQHAWGHHRLSGQEWALYDALPRNEVWEPGRRAKSAPESGSQQTTMPPPNESEEEAESA